MLSGLREGEHVYDQALAEKIIRRPSPELSETPLTGLKTLITPVDKLYVRNHFSVPSIDPTEWRLAVDGLVRAPARMSLKQLRAYPTAAAVSVVECAGNGGASGHLLRGGMGVIEWRGVRGAAVLEAAGGLSDARFVNVRGVDTGRDPDEDPSVTRYERSIPIEIFAERAILATHMNGEPLTPDHGAPLRLVMPGWYAMDWIKWLSELTLTAEASCSTYMEKRYRRFQHPDGESYGPMVRQIAVKSVITIPAPNLVVKGDQVDVSGLAWTGAGQVDCVDVRAGDMPWQRATIADASDSGDVVWWHATIAGLPAGTSMIVSRAHDSAGREQPESPHGGMYECNHITGVVVHRTADVSR